ncbi:hypothetical protein ACRALDRAFT_2099629 [Sodiomyces alcalophilus JCM 7366]|uniref:uncharacterized protein n=1 Tax=Sodiomyces alcalophilus JCM 7366 TaxID=591952 RepID=UPI0039B4C84E
MDFTHQYYANSQPYQYMGIQPLTPSHSNSAASDDFNNNPTTSPPDIYTEYPADQHFNTFDPYVSPPFNPNSNPAASHAANHAVFPGPPTPPNQHPVASARPTQLHHQQHHHHSQNGMNAVSTPAQSIKPQSELLAHRQESGDDQQHRRGGSNSDEEDLTPAQSRRKAQNRAAQRAFRERKEKHVKELEAKLANLEAAAQQTTSENERLKREMQKIATENEILRATSTMNGSRSLSPEPQTTGPMQYSPTDFYSDLLAPHNNKTPSHRIAVSGDGQRLLGAGATWDLIINHELFKQGLVDVGDVSDRLKNQAKCDGQGPVFPEGAIIEAIEASVSCGSDELL